MTSALTVAAIRDRQDHLRDVLRRVQPHRIRPRSVGKRILSLYRAADLHDPALVSTDSHQPFRLLAEQDWRRPLWTWDGGGGLAGLLGHLLVTVRYPLPDFLFALPLTGYHYGWSPVWQQGRQQLGLLAHLGGGGSMRAARDLGLIPACLTRRMQHALLAMEGMMSLGHAIRQAQLSVLGGDPALWEALRDTRLGQLLPDEHRWQPVLAWLCDSHDNLPAMQAGTLVDWLAGLPPDERDRRIRQPLAAAIQHAVQWHERLHIRPGSTSLQPGPLPDAGIPDAALPEPWTMRQIRSGIELGAEGAELRHCVASYWGSVMARQCGIFSLRRAGVRQVTVEVRLAERCVVQVRGLCNRRPTEEEERLIRAWAERVGLTVRAM